MRHRIVDDLMTREAVTVVADAPFKEIAGLLAEREISAVPVVDASDRLIGLVSEGDLVRWEARRADPGRHDEPDRAGGAGTPLPATAQDLMSAPVFTAHPGWSVVEAARAKDSHRVKRLPVIDEAGRVVGIVSRRDLLHVFLRSDRAIREEIEYEVLRDTLSLDPAAVRVHVVDGLVTLEGRVHRWSLIPVIERLVRSTDGVVSIDTQLTFDHDDS
jgi:CBS domain-containing protein